MWTWPGRSFCWCRRRTICNPRIAQLSDALGYSDQRTFQLVDEPLPGAPPPDVAPLIVEAFQNRPEIISQGLDVKSAQSYATAERDLWFPTISAAGVTGLVPFRARSVAQPLCRGRIQRQCSDFQRAPLQRRARRSDRAEPRAGAISPRSAEPHRPGRAHILAQRDLRLPAPFAHRNNLLDQTTQAFDLAKGRYQLGLSSIIELSQAQLNLTEAQVEQVSAQYDYESQTANLNYQLGRVK